MRSRRRSTRRSASTFTGKSSARVRSAIVSGWAPWSRARCFFLTLVVAVRLINKREKERRDTGSAEASTPNAAGRPRLWPLLKELLSLPLYLDYYRPSFHPWDHNNVHLINEWKQRYKTFGAGPDAHLHDGDEVTAS